MRRCTLFLLLILSTALHAQNFSGVAISALPGMPFTGQETIVWTHQVSDKTVTSRLVGTVARDSQGRTYREGHSFTVDSVIRKPLSCVSHCGTQSQASPLIAFSPRHVCTAHCLPRSDSC